MPLPTQNVIGPKKPIDWSHEREWRWPYRDSIDEYERYLEEYGIPDDLENMPALKFENFALKNCGVIAKSGEEAKRIVHDILTLVDRGVICQDQYDYVLSTDTLPAVKDLRDESEVRKAIAAATIDLSPYFKPNAAALNPIRTKFKQLVKSVVDGADPPLQGEPGGCWLWLLDGSCDLSRALLHAGQISLTREGRYLVPIAEFGTERDLRQREGMVNELAGLVKSVFGVESGYFSVLGSHDPDGVPFYCGDHLDNDEFYNKSWA